jgi:phospholipid/cholesterol/gamma-HCH transport system substrate-binding protein
MARGKSFSFLERNQRVIGLIALVLIVAGTAFALLLQGGFFTAKYRVTAMFSDAAGIRAGDFVTVAGLPAGKVEDLSIKEGQVAMELGVEEDVELTADTRAEVVIETLLGRKSVSLISGQAAEPLKEGDVIPIDRTTTPIDITELNDISVDLLEASDAEAFEQFLGQVTAVTEGKAREVQALIDGLEQVTAAVDARRSQLAGLIDSLRTLSTTFGQRDQRMVSLIDNLNVVLGNLAQRQESLETLLVSTDSASHETADLVQRNRGVLDSALRSVHVDLEVLNRHQLDLAATITYLEQAVQGYSTVGYSSGTDNRWANIFVQSLGPAGVDAVVGQCGLVDQLFDTYFGTNCEDFGSSPRTGGTAPPTSAVPPGTEGLPPGVGPDGLPETPGLPSGGGTQDLPCSIGDVVDSAVDGTVPPAEGRCDGV